MTNLYNDSAPSIAGSRAKSTLTAFFDHKSDAESAVDKLKPGQPEVGCEVDGKANPSAVTAH